MNKKKAFCDVNSAPEDNAVPADIRYTIYCTTIANGEDSDWDFLWKRFQTVQVIIS